MVALSPATARLLGFLDEGDERTLEMSGRKGIGVKADDLIDRLEAKSREEIASRNRELGAAALDSLAHQIAVAALRFFMAKATTNRVIAFDFDEALSFEGESGPYLQYSLVRAKNIRRRLREEGLADEVSADEVARLAPELLEDDLWDLILTVAQTGEVVERAVAALELSLLARHALEIAQRWNAVYHRHPILQEKDPARRAARLAAVQACRRGLDAMGGLLGIPEPERMCTPRPASDPSGPISAAAAACWRRSAWWRPSPSPGSSTAPARSGSAASPTPGCAPSAPAAGCPTTSPPPATARWAASPSPSSWTSPSSPTASRSPGIARDASRAAASSTSTRAPGEASGRSCAATSAARAGTRSG